MKGRLPVIQVESGGVRINGMPLFTASRDVLKLRLAELVGSQKSHLVVTPNVDQLIDLSSSDLLQRAYSRASLRLIDGMPIVRLAQALGAADVTRNTGADLLPTAAEWAGELGWRIAILGGSTSAGNAAAAALRTRNPGAQVEHVPFPMLSDMQSEKCRPVIQALRQLRPNLIFVCLGSPKQEEWVLEWLNDLPAGVYIGAGAAVDFAAGAKSRAPQAVQRLGFEWLWRLCQEPRRLGFRYLVRGPKFVGIIIKSIRGKNI